MKNFKRGGDFGDRKSFGRDRGDSKPAMRYKATCSECGNSCDVPFKPMSNKPVFCDNCFKGKDSAPSAFSARPARGRDERPSFSSRSNSFDEKRMFEATCSECGNSCEVPFKPTSGKPVFCSTCFSKNEGGDTNRRAPREREERRFSPKPNDSAQFDLLSKKLDEILKALNSRSSVEQEAKEAKVKKEVIVKEEVKEVKKAPAKKEKEVKAVVKTKEVKKAKEVKEKKVVAKKATVKKVVVKKAKK